MLRMVAYRGSKTEKVAPAASTAMIATTRSTPRWAKIMTTSPRCMPLCTKWCATIAVASEMCLYVKLRSGVLLVAVSTTHGRSGCRRALAANISWIGPLKSDQCRSAVGSGIPPLVTEPMVALNGRVSLGDWWGRGFACPRGAQDARRKDGHDNVSDGET